MSNKLSDRINSYQHTFDYKLLGRLPIIIVINGRVFSKLTSLLDKPYCPKLAECLISTMLKLCVEIEGTIFAYQHNDEIVVIARNDQSLETIPWYDNKLQKICSITASIATLHFSNCANALDLNLMGDPIFASQIFTAPNIIEAINTIIYKQQSNFYTSIQFACYYELIKKYDKSNIRNMLNGLSIDEKIDLLQQECGIDFSQYLLTFRRGTAAYKVPKISDDNLMRYKWIVNSEVPIFTKSQEFLTTIFTNGHDIVRSTNL